MQIEHELGERSLEAGHAAPEHGEARLGDPGGAFRVEPQRGADLFMRLGRETERPWLAPVTNLDVVVLALAHGDRWVGHVRELEQEPFESLVDRLELGVEGLDALADLAHARLLGSGVLAAALGLADRLGGFVAQRLEIVALADEPAALGVEDEQLVDELGAALGRESAAYRFGLVADQPDVKHARY